MLNFTFYSPTKFVFGKGEEKNIGKLLAERGTKKVLLHYGGQSAEKSGLLGRVRTSLDGAGIAYVELGGVHPNPRYSLAKEGMELARKENVDLILAVGGGSVVDSSKCIAIGALYDGDVWQDFYMDKKEITAALPVACILTIAAAGSEGSPGTVISNREVGIKEGVRASDLLRPRAQHPQSGTDHDPACLPDRLRRYGYVYPSDRTVFYQHTGCKHHRRNDRRLDAHHLEIR